MTQAELTYHFKNVDAVPANVPERLTVELVQPEGESHTQEDRWGQGQHCLLEARCEVWVRGVPRHILVLRLEGAKLP